MLSQEETAAPCTLEDDPVETAPDHPRETGSETVEETADCGAVEARPGQTCPGQTSPGHPHETVLEPPDDTVGCGALAVGPVEASTKHPYDAVLEIIGRRGPEGKARDALCRARATLRLTHPLCFVGGPDARRSCEAVRGLDMELAEVERALDELVVPTSVQGSVGDVAQDVGEQAGDPAA